MRTTTDRLTGTRLELTTTLAVPVARLWDVVTDVPAIGLWSPECIGATWLDGATSAVRGARFAARNRFGAGDDATVLSVTGVVTECVAQQEFAWAMLDDHGQIGSSWRYELEPLGSRTRVRHAFEHGPGATGLRAAADHDATAIDLRLGALACNVSATLAAMEHHVTGRAA